MNEELIKELNKRVIEQYTGVLNDINNKINNLEGIFNAEGLDTEEKNNLEGIITDLKSTRDKLMLRIENLKKKDSLGKSLFYDPENKSRTIIKNTSYEDRFVSSLEKNSNVEEKINKLNETISNVSKLGNSKFVSRIKGTLEKRVEALKKKQGRIQNRQSKIVDKAISSKLKSYVSKVKEKGIVFDAVEKNNQNAKKNNQKIEELTTRKEQLDNVKEALNQDGSLFMKGIGASVMFHEKLTEARIKGLQSKNCVLGFTNKQLVKAGVGSSIIQKMKDKVQKFAKALGESFKAGVETFKGYYNTPLEPTPARLR